MVKIGSLRLREKYKKKYGLQALNNEPGSISRSVRQVCAPFEGQSAPPLFLLENQEEDFSAYDGRFFSPAVYLHEIDDAAVIGRTEFVLKGDVLHHPHVIDPKQDVFMAEIEGKGQLAPEGNQFRLATVASRHVPRALSLFGQCNGNYAHFLTEALTRLALADTVPELSGLPLLVENNLHPRLYEALDLLNTTGRDIVFVREYERVTVDKLYYMTPPCYSPPETRSWFQAGQLAKPRQSQFVFSRDALKLLRTRCSAIGRQYVPLVSRAGFVGKPAATAEDAGSAPNDVGFLFHQGNEVFHSADTQRFYLERRAVSVGNGRLVVNEEIIKSCLKRQKFTNLHLSDLTFAEQAIVLSEAITVVSPVGASIANLIFAEPGVQVVLLTPFYPGASHFYFANLLGTLGHKLTYVLGRQVTQGNQSKYNRNFWVPVNLVQQAVRADG